MDTETRRQIELQIPRLRRCARLLTHDPELADDLVKGCLERAVSSFRHADGNLRRRLFTILLGLVRTGWLTLPGGTMSEWQPARSAATKPFARDLQQVFTTLPYSCQCILVLVVIERMSYEDAACVLDVPVGVVGAQLSGARRLLAARLEELERCHDDSSGAFSLDSAGFSAGMRALDGFRSG